MSSLARLTIALALFATTAAPVVAQPNGTPLARILARVIGGRRISSWALAASSWRRGRRRWRFKLSEGGAQRVEAWGVREFVLVDEASDGGGDGGEFGVGEVDGWHGFTIR